jgi:hypothetical protein
MKPWIRVIFGCFGLTLISSNLFADFSVGNLVIDTVGNGTSTLSSAATQTNLFQYTTSGTLVNQIALPTSSTLGGNQSFTNSGTATSEGALSLSANGQYLTLTGYSASLGTASIASSTSANDPRVVAVVDASGNINTTTTINNAFSGNNIRSAVTTNGQTFDAAGANSGVQQVSLGATTSTMVSASSAVTNLRVLEYNNGSLYASSASGSNIGINLVNTTTGAISLITSGGPVNGSNVSTFSPYAYVFLGNNLYVADSTNGIDKFVENGTTGFYNYVASTALPNSLTGLTGLTGSLVNGEAILYGTDPTTLLSFTDTDTTDQTNGIGTILVSTLATAGTDYAFRGIAFAPAPAVSVPEPASIAMTAFGVVCLIGVARRRRSIGARQ